MRSEIRCISGHTQSLPAVRKLDGFRMEEGGVCLCPLCPNYFVLLNQSESLNKPSAQCGVMARGNVWSSSVMVSGLP